MYATNGERSLSLGPLPVARLLLAGRGLAAKEPQAAASELHLAGGEVELGCESQCNEATVLSV